MDMRNGSCATLLAIGLLSPLGCGAGVDGADGIGSVSEELTSASVAHMAPAGVVESQGNLYWTMNRTLFGFPVRYSNTVYRASKGSAPGQETALYTETSTSPFYFGSIAFGMANGVWYGYFVVDYSTQSVIKRVPLDGSGPAVTMNDLTGHVGAHTPLYADGSYLYFMDGTGIWAMLFAGTIANPIVQAANITTFTLAPSFVWYAVGKTISYAPKIGVSVSGGSYPPVLFPVSMLAYRPTSPAYVFWSDGTMVSELLRSTYWGSAGSGRMITSLDDDGTHVLWIDCTTGGNACAARVKTSTSGSPVSVSLPDYSRNIQADSYDSAQSRFFYTSYTDLMRVTYT